MIIDENRLKGAIITISIVLIIWIIMWIKFFKSEPKVENVNMANSYKNANIDELLKYGINYEDFKKIIYQKFVDIHIALCDMNIDVLKKNLTDDLYKSYAIELDNLKINNKKIIMKDFELVDFKVYNILELCGLLHIDIYLNVRLLDYVIDMNSGKCISGDQINKMDFEYELNFVKKIDTGSDYLLSKKTCVNNMDIKKNKK